jgi:lipopolysaccharide/colanic/teichoic acid biosynthesis glycosyltransferase
MGNHTEVLKQKNMSFHHTHDNLLENRPSLHMANVQATLQATAKKRQLYAPVKRAFDLSICIMSLVPVLGILILVAVAIWKEDGGPIFFVQERTGYKGKRFKMLKFRTMVTDAEARKQELMHLNELQWPDFKIKDDPRITKIGRFLRRTSLDEIPQVLNILAGHMSFVGPRPTSFAAETYQSWQMARLEAVPGLTGLWQISGRSDVDFDERVRLDIEYIENQSFLYDLSILLRTFSSVRQQKGAY